MSVSLYPARQLRVVCHIDLFSIFILVPAVLSTVLFGTGITTRWTAVVNLLLQHDTVHACFEQGECEARLSFQFAEAVEDFGAWLGSEVVEDGSQL